MSINDNNEDLCRELIVTTLQNRNESIKRNKLRKLICNNESNSISWTAFAKTIDGLLLSKTIVCSKEDHIQLRNGKLKRSNAKEKEKVEVEKDNNDVENKFHMIDSEAAPADKEKSFTRVVTIPKFVAQHLQKKNMKKIRNIEKNTNTILTLTPLGDRVSYTILVQSKDMESSDSIDINKKRINFAASLIKKMVKLVKDGNEKIHEGKLESDKLSKKKIPEISSNSINSEESMKKKIKKKRKRDKFY